MSFYNEPGFWGAVASGFGFLTASVGAFRYLARVQYLYNQKNIMVKAKFDSTIEKLKADNIAKSFECLQQTIDQMKQMLKANDQSISAMKSAMYDLTTKQNSLSEMFQPLYDEHVSFRRIVPKLTAGLQLAVDSVEKIKTEVTELKSGNYFVRTKR